MTPPALTVRAAAARLGYSPSTIYTMIANGELACVRRPGASIRITETQLAAWIEAHTCPATQQPQPSSAGPAGALGSLLSAAASSARAQRIGGKLNASSPRS